jgi:hypothetical protein
MDGFTDASSMQAGDLIRAAEHQPELEFACTFAYDWSVPSAHPTLSAVYPTLSAVCEGHPHAS